MNTQLLQKIRDMTEADLYLAVYQDPLTGALNRRAWKEIGEQLPYVVLFDLDSLKYVNDYMGYREGDKWLLEFFDVLQFTFRDPVYRLAGDEFAVAGRDLNELRGGAAAAQAAHPAFSFGGGDCLDSADRALKRQKIERTKCGKRAARGERPWWYGELML